MWSEVLAADAFAFMQQNGGLTLENGQAFRDTILSKGNSKEPMQQYIDFRGQEPTVEALLQRRGLTARKLINSWFRTIKEDRAGSVLFGI